MTDLSEPGDLDAWRNPPPPVDVDLAAARRRLHRRNAIVDYFQIGFLVIIPVLSAVTLLVARHADKRATSARQDTHALTRDVSLLTESVDRLTKNQEDTARIEAQVAAMAEAFRRIAVATTPAERQEAIDALSAIAPPATTTTTIGPTDAPASATSTAPSSSPATTAPPRPATTTTTPSSSTTTTTARPLIPALTLPTIPQRIPARSSSARFELAGGLGIMAGVAVVLFLLTVITRPERKPMTQPVTPEKAAPNAAGRILRTLYMVVIAIGVAIPAATAAFGFTAATSAKLVGLAGGITILVTALWNALEGAGVIGTVAATQVAPPATITTRIASDDVDLIAEVVHATAPAPAESFAVELDEDEVERLAGAVARQVVVELRTSAPAKKATPAKKAAPRRR